MKERDISGQRFGKLVAIERVSSSTPRHGKWLFRCDCGIEMPMFKSNVTRGEILSCIACGRPRQAKGITKHGRSHDPVYCIFHAAKQRCENPNDARYADYGGRGIKFLFQSFEQFSATLGPRPEGMTLERMNNDGHYEPGNVTWATRSEQQNNQRPRRRKLLAS